MTNKVTHLLNSGRLGNQLFQIASTIGIAKKNNSIPVFPVWDYSGFINGQITQCINITPTAVFHEDYFHYNDAKLTANGTTQLIGYFQSAKYWEGSEQEVIELLSPNKKVVNKLKHKYGLLLGKYETCSIHVRRGDYVGNSFYADLWPSYYEDAIKHIGAQKYLVISDDIEWCKKNFNAPDYFVYAEGNSDIEDLYLMSLCSKNIIANSSFSWWGAYLNKNKGKVVVAPKKWFGEGSAMDTKDLYVNDWVKL